MERQIFDWDSWERPTEGQYIFSQCELNRSLGEFSKGRRIPYILVDYYHGWLELQNAKREALAVFRVSLTLERCHERPIQFPERQWRAADSYLLHQQHTELDMRRGLGLTD